MRHECDTELILTAPVHQHRVVWGCMYDVTLKNRVKGINWHTAVFIALFHVGAVAALFVFNWKAVFVAILLWWLAGSLGVGIGFHRLLTGGSRCSHLVKAGTTIIMLTRLPRAMDLPGTKSTSTGGEFASCSFWGSRERSN